MSPIEAKGPTGHEGHAINGSHARRATTPSQFFRTVIYDAVAKSCGFGAIGIALYGLGRSLAWPFLGGACGMLSMRLVINVTKEYHLSLSQSVDEWRDNAWDFVKRNPYIKIVAGLFMCALASYSPFVSFAIGTGLGALSALTIEMELCLKQQQVQDAKERGDIIKQLV